MKALHDFLEFLRIAFIVWMLGFISWSKMTLGSALCFLGAFWPNSSKQEKLDTGTAAIKWSDALINFRGSVRMGVIAAGIILIGGAILEDPEKLSKTISSIKEAGAEVKRNDPVEECIDAYFTRLGMVRGPDSNDVIARAECSQTSR